MELGITIAGVVALVLLVLVFLYLSVRVVQQYEKMVVFRLGRTNEGLVRDPGLRFLIPIIDRPVKVDVREQFIEVPSQTTITRDNAPINVDFLIYWRIVDPLKSIVNVAYFAGALQGVATTVARMPVKNEPAYPDFICSSPPTAVARRRSPARRAGPAGAADLCTDTGQRAGAGATPAAELAGKAVTREATQEIAAAVARLDRAGNSGELSQLLSGAGPA